MIVVADTTPLNYLLLIGAVDVLPALYKTVWIPPAVHQELQRERTPLEVRDWAAKLPAWCEVRPVGPHIDSELSELDAGERQAIQLALESGIETILLDQREGRRVALRHRLRVTGTVAVLE